jgi:hypothetical protein
MTILLEPLHRAQQRRPVRRSQIQEAKRGRRAE